MIVFQNVARYIYRGKKLPVLAVLLLYLLMRCREKGILQRVELELENPRAKQA
jgi:hypothetical protein